jgi:hypothetical protein
VCSDSIGAVKSYARRVAKVVTNRLLFGWLSVVDVEFLGNIHAPIGAPRPISNTISEVHKKLLCNDQK